MSEEDRDSMKLQVDELAQMVKDLTSKLAMVEKTSTDQNIEKIARRAADRPFYADSYEGIEDISAKLPERFSPKDLRLFRPMDDPHHHIRGFLSTMALQGVDTSLLPKVFPLSLDEITQKWFYSLSEKETSTWKDLVFTFTNRYKSNVQDATSQRELEILRQREKEGFTDFLLRWKQTAAKMIKPPAEEDMVRIFIENLQPSYGDKLRYQGIESFTRLSKIGIQIENDLFKEGQRGKATTSRGASSRSVSAIHNVSTGPPFRPVFQKRNYTPIGMTYAQALDRLITKGRITLLGPMGDPPADKRRPNWDANKYCKYHQGRGHSTEECFHLKNKIQDMIEKGELPVPNAKPNTQTSPLTILLVEEEGLGFDPSVLITPTELQSPVELLLHSPINVNGIWDSDEEDVYIHDIPEARHHYENEIDFNEVSPEPPEENGKVQVMTRSGRLNIPPPEEANPTTQVPPPLEESIVVKQLKKTRADINIWQLIVGSKDHREALLNELAKVNIAADITPGEMVGLMFNEQVKPSVTFSDEDLPDEGRKHNKALHINVVCRHFNIPMTLIDNGSAINVCPLRTALRLGIAEKEFQESTQAIRAYDNSKRETLGTLYLNVTSGPVEKKTKFYVLDIKTNFNLLLGRPWLHELGAVPSTLHQKVRFLIEDTPTTIHAGSVKTQVIDEPVIHIEHDDTEEDLWGFSVAMIDEALSDYCPNLTVNTMMRNQGHFPGMPLGLHKTRKPSMPEIPLKRDTFGLGYCPSVLEKENAVRRNGKINTVVRPYPLTLNGQFIKQGEDYPYFEFPEPFMSRGKRYPGLEIFADCCFLEERNAEPITVGTQNIWDYGGLSLLFGQEPENPRGDDLVAVMNAQGFDPTELITPTGNQGQSWSKTAKITTSQGKAVNIIVGEGPTFEKAELGSRSSLEYESESESRVESVKEPPSHVAISNSATFDVIISDFNKIAHSAYSSPSTLTDCFNISDEELIKAMEQYEQKTPVIEETEKINISSDETVREVQIGLTLNPSERENLISLLREFMDVFAWSYRDMPGIDTEIAQHTIPLLPGAKPVKQKPRRMKPEIAQKIREEIQKQLDAGFIKVVNYPDWVANIVPVPKKDGRIRMCVDFRDLNKASPKDDFPLPHIDILIDNTANHALFSFMDGYAGYNQIKMAEEDMEKTTFTTPWGLYCYTVMPFGLKNAGATYQRTATALLHDMIHKEVEVYVDDMIVKSKDREGHIMVLRKFFERLRRFNMRLNPQKCAFGVTSGKLLGYVISKRGIEIDPTKIKAIMSLKPPSSEKEIRGFLGRLQYISRFISKLTMVCEPLFKKLKKDAPKEWDEQCQKAFDKVKEYLTNPPVLAPALPGIPLRLYLTVTRTAAGAMLAQEVQGKENAIYYISKKFLEYEERYSTIEKLCLALVWATRKLRHYLLTHAVHVICKGDPLKYLFEKPAMNGRMSRWTVLLSEFDLRILPEKSIKGSIVSDFLAESPGETSPEEFDFPDEELLMVEENDWTLYFDGASNQKGAGAGVLLVSPEEEHIPICVKLDFNATNNAAEYEACIIGIKAAIALKIQKLRVYGDSSLIINQIAGKWKVRNETLAVYQARLEELASRIGEVEYTYLKREDNQFADALAKLASMINMPDQLAQLSIVIERTGEPAYVNALDGVNDSDEEPWYTDIKKYLETHQYPLEATRTQQKALRLLASQFFLQGGNLYKRNHGGLNLRCVNKTEAEAIMDQVHAGVCGTHMNGRMLASKIIRLGYYWTTMEKDCFQYVRTCDTCQKYANAQHIPPSLLHTLTSPWPFSTWGIDIIGKVTPPGQGGHEFILVAIDYFTKWVEAASYATLKAKQVARFIETHIICRYGIPHEIISDNGSHFQAECAELIEKYKIKHHRSSPYRPQTNGAVEAANKNVKTIIAKMTETYKDWPHKLPFALWGYRTSIRTSTGATPFALVYGVEAVQPVELEIPSLRIVLESGLTEADWIRSRYDELILRDERRLAALHNVQVYQERIKRHFDRRVKSRNIKEGDLVLKALRKTVLDPRGKFRPQWAGPYIVKKILSGGAAQLTDLNGDDFSSLINLDQLKRYYA